MATKSQITKLHILLNNLQIVDEKKEMLLELTRGRTSSSKELTLNEARFLIGRLCECDPSERLKTVITNLAYHAGITYGNTETDRLINKAKLDMFLRDKGAVKKDLQKQTYPELRKTHRQFKAIYNNTLANNENKEAKAAVTSLLNELNVKTL